MKEVKKIGLDEIEVGERLREDPGDIEKLADSIDRWGLIHPILVLEEDRKYHLISGYRRYRAHKKLGKEEIKAQIMEG